MGSELTSTENAFAKLESLTRTTGWSPQQQDDFDNWFAKSMIHHGTPQVLFRGTAGNGDLFPQADGWYGRGIYLTDSSLVAEEYALDSQEAEGGEPKIVPAFVRLEFPYIFKERDQESATNVQLMQALGFTEPEIAASLKNDNYPQLIRNALQAAGHDGLIAQASEGTEYVAFEASQILQLPRGHQAVVDALDLEAKTAARRLGYDSVRPADPELKQPHVGSIVGATGGYYIQSTGRLSAVIHDKKAFAVAPEMGSFAEVRYEAGLAVVATPDRAKHSAGVGR